MSNHIASFSLNENYKMLIYEKSFQKKINF